MEMSNTEPDSREHALGFTWIHQPTVNPQHLNSGSKPVIEARACPTPTCMAAHTNCSEGPGDDIGTSDAEPGVVSLGSGEFFMVKKTFWLLSASFTPVPSAGTHMKARSVCSVLLGRGRLVSNCTKQR